LRVGAQQFKVSFEDLVEHFQSDAWAKRHCLVAVSGSRTDGSSGLQTPTGAFDARRQEIESFAKAVFSGSPQQEAFWRGEGADPPERIREVYGGLKPCLHGSDAHTADDLGRPDEDRFTWLKGDPTFDTLRFACLAPATRAHVGATSPSEGLEHGRISTVSVSTPDWTLTDQMPINSGLVAVIGARGSGKTALVDLIAAGAGSDQPFDNESSFINRARALLTQCVVDVGWTDGEKSRYDFTRPDLLGDDAGITLVR
jgi:hypothetical protein